MSATGQRIVATLLPVSAFVLCLGMAAKADSVHVLPTNRATDVRGVDIVCTGVGEGTRDEGRWKRYPVKLEAVGGYGQYLANEEVTLHSRGGALILRAKCDAPWVLMRLDPGRYQATMRVPNAPAKRVDLTVPRKGYRDIVVRFPGLAMGRDVGSHAAQG